MSLPTKKKYVLSLISVKGFRVGVKLKGTSKNTPDQDPQSSGDELGWRA